LGEVGCLAQFSGEGSACVGVTVYDDNFAARLYQTMHTGFAEAGRAARDQGDCIFEFHKKAPLKESFQLSVTSKDKCETSRFVSHVLTIGDTEDSILKH
jgi:hypothetical protein